VLKTPVGRFRAIAFVEGVSALILFFVAMPIKYVDAFGRDPTPVRYAGWVHGILYLLYAVAGFQALYARGWGFREASWGFVASIVPGGTFVYYRFRRREKARSAADQAATADTLAARM
jgi:integral membrane protein